jgi:hypothetical protein
MKRFTLMMKCSFIIASWLPFFSQAQADTSLQTPGEIWNIKAKKKLFGLAKPEFGPYSTIAVYQLDSAVHRKKTKDPEGASFSLSGSEGVDITKLQTIEKQKYFKLLLAISSDTIEVVFAIASISKERKQTVGGILLSKNGTSSNATLSYNRDVSGTIKVHANDTAVWKFFIDDFTSGSRETEEWGMPHASIAAVYLKKGNDSSYTKLPMGSLVVDLYRSENEKIGTLAYTGKKATVWVRKDIDSAQQHAVAALFAAIISIRDL